MNSFRKIMRTMFASLMFTAMLPIVYASQPAGYVIEWGWNTAAGTAAAPKLVASNAIAVSAGPFHSLALTSDGKVFAWGDNFLGETLRDKTIADGLTNGFVSINGQPLVNMTFAVAGRGLSLALARDGTVIGWGIAHVPDG